LNLDGLRCILLRTPHLQAVPTRNLSLLSCSTFAAAIPAYSTCSTTAATPSRSDAAVRRNGTAYGGSGYGQPNIPQPAPSFSRLAQHSSVASQSHHRSHRSLIVRTTRRTTGSWRIKASPAPAASSISCSLATWKYGMTTIFKKQRVTWICIVTLTRSVMVSQFEPLLRRGL
jgi:hypothetical protein